MVRLY